jgi:hypothetical protein
MEIHMNSEKNGRTAENTSLGWKVPVLPDATRWMEAYRKQFQLALELGDALLQGVERMQGAQLQAAREIQAQNRKSADALAGAADVRELMSAQSALTSVQWQAAMRQLSGMAEIVQKTNLDCMQVLQSRCMSLGDNWKEAAATPAFGAAGMPGSWQSAMDAARASGEAMMKMLTGQAASPQSAARTGLQKAKAA